MVIQIVHDIIEIVAEYMIPNLAAGIVFLLLVFGFFSKGKKTEKKAFWAMGYTLLFVYILFVIELTLLTREAGSRVGVSLTFWGTYADDMMAQCWMIENAILFLPFGILLPMVFKKMQRPAWLLLAAFLCSLSIETTQLITQRGFFQVDDIWLNVLGALLGFILWKLAGYWGTGAVVCGALFLLFFWTIFGFSAQTGTQSSGLSDKIAGFLSTVINDCFHGNVTREQLTFPVRKTAHMTEYAILWMDAFAMLSFGRCYRQKKKQKKSSQFFDWKKTAGSLAMVLLVSISDEYHQTFVPGRSGKPVDVGWDMLGVTLCLLVVFCCYKCYVKHKKE